MSTKSTSFMWRLVRTTLSVVVLTAFVLGTTLVVKSIYEADEQRLLVALTPVLTLIGLDKSVVGEVAGEFVWRVNETGIKDPGQVPTASAAPTQYSEDSLPSIVEGRSSKILVKNAKKTSQLALTVGVVADSHDDNSGLEEALTQLAEYTPDFVIHLGDFTDWGDIASLNKAKTVLSENTDIWYALPGDHDLAQSVGLANYKQVFGDNTNYVVTKNNLKFVFFDNSANFTPLEATSLTWFEENISSADFVLVSQPLYHPVSDRIMGIANGEIQKDLSLQREELLTLIRAHDIQAVFSADHHSSSVHPDPQDSSLSHIVFGAITSTRNLQKPRFSILKIYSDKTFDIEEVIL